MGSLGALLLRRLCCGLARWRAGLKTFLLLFGFDRRMFVTIFPADDVPDLNRDIIINRAGMRFLFSDAELGQ
jgi:hypothetical protein